MNGELNRKLRAKVKTSNTLTEHPKLGGSLVFTFSRADRTLHHGQKNYSMKNQSKNIASKRTV